MPDDQHPPMPFKHRYGALHLCWCPCANAWRLEVTRWHNIPFDIEWERTIDFGPFDGLDVVRAELHHQGLVLINHLRTLET